MNFRDNITVLARVALAGFLLLIVALSYQQVAMGGRYRRHPLNHRDALRLAQIKQGTIRDSTRTVLAETRRGEGGFQRTYPEGRAFCQLLGYQSVKLGAAGLQKRYADELVGADGLESPFAQLWRDEKAGHDLTLTLNASAQKVAAEALEGRNGAVVALDPRSGEVLVMASSPMFDPNFVDDAWELIRKDPAAPLLNRCIQGQYPPGSAIKILTAAAALDAGVATPETKFRCEGRFKVDGAEVVCHRTSGHGLVDMSKALAVSCNVYFAKLGLELGAERLEKAARAFGFGTRIEFDLPVTVSSIGVSASANRAALAEAAFGQGKVIVTPLQMALIAAAIGNEGRMMAPRVLRSVESPEGRVLRETTPRELGRPVSAATAQTVKDLMVGVVEHGTGAVVQSRHVQIAGKTGSAENPHGEPHAWFVALAPADAPTVAVAVIVENAGRGGEVAGPIARDVIEALVGW
jgi:peptidoglycan glycosyltransferase